jgi:hypothetical protein
MVSLLGSLLVYRLALQLVSPMACWLEYSLLSPSASPSLYLLVYSTVCESVLLSKCWLELWLASSWACRLVLLSASQLEYCSAWQLES